MTIKLLITTCCLLIIFITVKAEDTLRISLQDAEKMLQTKNLQLIAQHYNINIAEAQVIQAKVFANPEIDLQHNLYNTLNHKWFDISRQGQTAFSIQEVFNLAAQRSKQIKLAKVNQQIVGYQYEDVVRSLKGSLKSVFLQVYFLRKSLDVYDREIKSLSNLVYTMIDQQKKGNISMVQLVRLEAFLLSIKSEKSAMMQNFINYQQQLNLLLDIPKTVHVYPTMDDTFALQKFTINTLAVDTLLHIVEDRPDLKVAEATINLSKANLTLQKSMRAPDFTFSATYDKNGSNAPDYSGLGITLSIPIFNRNQGNIKAAKFQVQQSHIQKDYVVQQAQNDVMVAYMQLQDANNLYKSINTDFENNFEVLIKGVEENFKKKNINMLEFLDYYGSYKDAFIQLYQTKMNLFLAMENLNTSVGRNIINY